MMIRSSSPYILFAVLIAAGSYWLGTKSVATSSANITVSSPPKTKSLLATGAKDSARHTENKIALNEQLATAFGLVRYDNGSLARARLTLLIEEIEPALLVEAFAEACQLAKGNRLQSDPVVRGILERWYKLDPKAAYDATFDVVTWGTNDMRRDMQLDLARMPLIELSKRDPKAAFDAWTERMPQLDKDYDNSTEFLLSSVFESWAEQEFDAALRATESLSQDEAKEAISGMIRAAPDRQSDLLAMLEESGADKLLKEVKRGVVIRMVRNGQTEEAIAWVDEQPVEARSNLERELAEWWLREDPHGASEWYLTRGNEGDLDRRIDTIVRRWAEWEPNVAGEWLGRMAEEHGHLADRAKARFARTIFDKDTESALIWLESISNRETRLEAAESIGTYLQGRGLKADTELVEASGLANEERHALLGN